VDTDVMSDTHSSWDGLCGPGCTGILVCIQVTTKILNTAQSTTIQITEGQLDEAGNLQFWGSRPSQQKLTMALVRESDHGTGGACGQARQTTPHGFTGPEPGQRHLGTLLIRDAV
jgi:hypothetical protein